MPRVVSAENKAKDRLLPPIVDGQDRWRNAIHIQHAPAASFERRSRKVPGLVPTSRLVGSDLRAWHRSWTEYEKFYSL